MGPVGLILALAALSRLTDPADRDAFRRWFTYLTEAQYFRTAAELPSDITDCAGLIRYSYRETLRRHDDGWRNGLGLRLVPSLPAVRGMANPGVNLFRTGPDSSAQFADAKTLRQWNTHFVTRDARQAQPGDILFYKQASQHMPFHTMVFIGASQVDGSVGPWLVYHTGPGGEIRRIALSEMMRHPDPQWRPLSANENFLGIYRWNIL